MLIMITGEMNIGKSTIIDKICTKFSLDICGFCTREYFKGDVREGFFIKEIFDNKAPSYENIIAKMDSDFKPIVFPQAFDNLGVKLAHECLISDKRIIIIDEIGVFESKSDKFVQALDEILQSDKIVVAVLKKRDHIFLNKYKNLYNPIEITVLNRDKVAENIINKIKINL